MRTTIIMLPLAALAACAVSGDAPVEASAAGKAALSEATEGRVPGEPVSCVRQQDVRNSRSAGDNVILWDGRSGVVYVNRTAGACPRIRPWHAILHRTVSTNICSGELIRVFDPQTGVEYGGCTLGEFTPYRRTN